MDAAALASHRQRHVRGLRIAVFHPKDEHRAPLLAALARLGCIAHSFWPPTIAPPAGTELVLVDVRDAGVASNPDWTQAPDAPPVVALIADDDPASLDAALTLAPGAVLSLPLRPADVLPALLLARATQAHMRLLLQRVQRLERRLATLNLLHDAKTILMRTRELSEPQAYALIREQAMAQRVPTEQIARTIIDAHRLLGF